MNNQIRQRSGAFVDAPDHCSLAGALVLAKRIEAYWAERGGKVYCTTVSLGFSCKATKETFVGVRSDTLNGAPSHG